MNRDHALDALSALSQPTRLDAFRLLVQAGPDGLAAGEIAVHLGARQNTMSSHLAVLTRAGLIDSTRNGRSIRYRANFSGMQRLVDFLLLDCCSGVSEIVAPVIERAQKETTS